MKMNENRVQRENKKVFLAFIEYHGKQNILREKNSTECIFVERKRRCKNETNHSDAISYDFVDGDWRHSAATAWREATSLA
jgi:hypothetical protein